MKTEAKKTGRVGAFRALEQQVADLEEQLIQMAMERDAAVNLLCQRDAELAARPAADALLAFAAGLPRKQLYRILARELHPDVGGETATMQRLTAAWAATQG